MTFTKKKHTYKNNKTRTLLGNKQHINNNSNDNHITQHHKRHSKQKQTQTHTYIHVNKLINKLITRHNLSLKLKQNGGMFGIDFIALKWKIKKFNGLITKINTFDLKIQTSIASYAIQLEIFKTHATRKAEILTELLNNYRLQIILQIYSQDTEEHRDTNKIDELINKNKNNRIEKHLKSLDNRAQEIDKKMKSNLHTYDELMKKLKSDMKDLQKITKEYTDESTFYQSIVSLRSEYDNIIRGVRNSDAPAHHSFENVVSVKDGNTTQLIRPEPQPEIQTLTKSERKSLTKDHIRIIDKFDKHKAQYIKICDMDDSAFQKRTNIEERITKLMRAATSYLSQFNINNTKGKIIEKLEFIDCKHKSGILCEWKANYEEFAEKMFTSSELCKNIITKLKTIEDAADACVYQLAPIVKSYKEESHLEAALKKMRDDIKDLGEITTLVSESITQLKIKFYHQTPAARMLYDYNEITTELHYIEDKTRTYTNIFKKIKELNEFDNTDYISYAGGAITQAIPQALPQATTQATTQATATPHTPQEYIHYQPPDADSIMKLKNTFDNNTTQYESNINILLTKIIQLLEDIFFSVLQPLYKDYKWSTLKINKYNKIFYTINEYINKNNNSQHNPDIISGFEKNLKDLEIIKSTFIGNLIPIINNNINNIKSIISNNNSIDEYDDENIKHIISKINTSLDYSKAYKKIPDTSSKQDKHNYSDVNKYKEIIENIFNEEHKRLDKTNLQKHSPYSSDNKTVKTDTDTDKEKSKNKLNYNLIEDVMLSFNSMPNSDYEDQRTTIINKFIFIKATLIELVDDISANPIKTLANLMNDLTKILQNIKVIEPQIVKVEVKEQNLIDIDAGWIVKKADTDFDDLQSLDITNKLQEKRLKNREIQKIYEKELKVISDSDIQILITILVASNLNAGLLNEKLKGIFTNLATFTKLIDAIKIQYPKTATDRRNGCTIIHNINKVITLSDGNILKAFHEFKSDYGDCSIPKKESKMY